MERQEGKVIVSMKKDFEKFCKIVEGRYYYKDNAEVCEIDGDKILEIGFGKTMYPGVSVFEYLKRMAWIEVIHLPKEERKKELEKRIKELEEAEKRQERIFPLIYVKNINGDEIIFNTFGEVKTLISRLPDGTRDRIVRVPGMYEGTWTFGFQTFFTYKVRGDIFIKKVDNTYYIEEK